MLFPHPGPLRLLGFTPEGISLGQNGNKVRGSSVLPSRGLCGSRSVCVVGDAGWSWILLICPSRPNFLTREPYFIKDNTAQLRGHGMNSLPTGEKWSWEAIWQFLPLRGDESGDFRNLPVSQIQVPRPKFSNSARRKSSKPQDRRQLQVRLWMLDSLNSVKAIWQHLGRVLSWGVGLALLCILAGKRCVWRCLCAGICFRRRCHCVCVCLGWVWVFLAFHYYFCFVLLLLKKCP